MSSVRQMGGQPWPIPTQHKKAMAQRRLTATFSLVTILLGLSACATRTAPVVPPEKPPISRPQPSAPQAPVHALNRMLQESRAQVAAGDWQAAIVSAERGLRIDRREPELYLLLATSYWELADGDRARQFARQGLRYVVDPRSLVAEKLNDLLIVLESAEVQ
jgi:Tfp pilus assembly protein PilF